MRAGQTRKQSGQDRPRWRAKLRHRYDRAQGAKAEPLGQLTAWIEAQGWATQDVDELERLDLTTYLRTTAHVELAPAERLRQLAIALESTLAHGSDQPRGWFALERIYGAARALDPANADVETSRAITAKECAESAHFGERSDVERRILTAGREAASRAIELRPEDARAHYVMGSIEYGSRDGSIEAALSCFEKAVELDPGFGWSRLYRAHCLHDMSRWAEAVEAYSAVDPAFFVGPIAWRYDLLREQRAWCRLQAGDRDRALAEFLAVLQRYEQQPNLARYQLLKDLTAAAEGPLRAELSEGLARLHHIIHPPDESIDTEADAAR